MGRGCGSFGREVALTLEILGLNLGMGKIISSNCSIEKPKNKEKEAGKGPSFEKN